MIDGASSAPTRVALRIAGGPGPAFRVAAARHVMEVEGAQVVLVVSSGSNPNRSRVDRLVDLIAAGYDRLERRVLRGGPRALEPQAPWPMPVTVRYVVDGPAANRALRDSGAAVLIDLAPDRPTFELPTLPNGHWTLSYAVGVGGPRRPRLDRPRADVALAESLLSIESEPGQVLESEIGVSRIQRVGFGRDRDAVYWRSALLPSRRLARLVAGAIVPSPTDSLAPLEEDRAPVARPARRPLIVGLVATLAGKAVERLVFRSGWEVMVRERESGQGPPADLTGFEPIAAPPGQFYADPFVVDAEDGPRIYVEDCPDGSHRGRISVLRLQGRRWTLDRVVLDDLDHRAYPHIVSTKRGLLMTPDSGRNGGVDLFIEHGSDAGPERLGHVLADVPASDPTVLWHEGRYWLFVNVTGTGMSPWDELHVYSAAGLTSVWHPHPRNPVVSDVRRARPAGRIIKRGDELIRPGQDCSLAYGRRIVLSSITTLTQDQYEEHPIGSIEPVGITGFERTHTYSVDGTVEVLDGYRRRLRRPLWRTPS